MSLPETGSVNRTSVNPIASLRICRAWHQRTLDNRYSANASQSLPPSVRRLPSPRALIASRSSSVSSRSASSPLRRPASRSRLTTSRCASSACSSTWLRWCQVHPALATAMPSVPSSISLIRISLRLRIDTGSPVARASQMRRHAGPTRLQAGMTLLAMFALRVSGLQPAHERHQRRALHDQRGNDHDQGQEHDRVPR